MSSAACSAMLVPPANICDRAWARASLSDASPIARIGRTMMTATTAATRNGFVRARLGRPSKPSRKAGLTGRAFAVTDVTTLSAAAADFMLAHLPRRDPGLHAWLRPRWILWLAILKTSMEATECAHNAAHVVCKTLATPRR